MTHPLAPLARELADRTVRYVLIGVSGANFYGPNDQAVFSTKHFDLFLPTDPDNLVRTWDACERAELGSTVSRHAKGRARTVAEKTGLNEDGHHLPA